MGPGSTRSARPPFVRHLLPFSIGYAVAHRLGYQFLDPETQFATIWPANGVAVAGLLLAPMGSEAVVLAVFTAIAIVSSRFGGHPAFAVAGFGLANLLEISLAFAGVTWLARRDLDFTRVGDAAALLVTSAVASAAAGMIGAPTAVRLSGASFATCFGHWWVPDMLGLLLVTPFLVSWLRCAPGIRRLTGWRAGEAIAFTITWTAAGWASFAPSAPDLLLAQPYVLLALLPWPALRFGARGVTAAVFGVAVVILNPHLVPPTHPGMAAIGGPDPILGLQSYLAIASTAGLMLAASVRQTQTAEARAREEHERLEFLSNNIPDGTLYQVVREHDGRMRFTYISSGLERLHGIPVEEALRDASLVYARARAEDRERIAAAEERSFRTGEPFDEILQVPTPGGDLRWKRVTSMPRRLEDGRAVWDGLETDITEQRRAQDEARRNAEHLELALHSARMGTWEWTGADQKLTLSGGAREVLGVTPERPVESAADFLAITHPDDRGIVTSVIDEAAHGGRDEWSDVRRIVWWDGSVRWIEGRGRLQRGPDGRVQGAAGVVVDVTERKLVDARLARVNRALRTLSHCTRSVARATDERALLHEVCGLIAEVGGYPLAWVGFAEHDPEHSISIAAHAGPSSSFLDGVRVTWGESATGRGPTGRAMRTASPQVCNDILDDRSYEPWRRGALAAGFRSGAAFPLVEGPTPLGTLTVYASEVDAFDDAEIELLAELARDLGHGIEALRERASRERAEGALAASETLLRSAMESSPIGMIISGVDGSFEYVNPALCRMLGFSPDDLIGRRVQELIHPDDLAEVSVRVEALLTGKATSYDIEKRYLRADGTIQWVQVSRTLVKGSDRTPPHFLAQVQDITERMRSSEALLKSNARLRLAMDVARIGYWEYDVDTDTFEFDDEFFRLLRTTAQREGGNLMPAAEYARRFLPPEWAPAVGIETRAAVATRDPHYRRCIEHPIQRADGSLGVLEVEIRVVKDASGRTIRTFGANQDVTERRLAEQALRDSEERLRTAMESSPIGMAIVATDGRLLAVNPALSEILGYTRHELLERTSQELTHPDDLTRDLAQVERLLAGDDDTYQIERRYIRADGVDIHAQLNVSLVRDDEGQPLHFFSQVQDVTERVRAEAEIRESNTRLRLVMEIAKLGYWDFDVASGTFTFNDDFYRLFGTTAADEGGYTMSAEEYARRFLPADVARELPSYVANALTTSDPHHRGMHEHEIRRRDGSTGVLQVEARVIKDAAGQTVRIYGANQDVTERVRAEEAIRESNGKLRLAMDIARLGYWEFDLATHRLTLDDGILKMLRTSVDQEGTRSFALEQYARRFIPPENTHIVEDGFAAALASTGSRYRNVVEHPIVRADGSRGVIQVQVRAERDASGRIVRAYGCNQDITERAEAELALRESEERFRQVVEHIQEVFWMTDRDSTQVLYVSPAYETVWGRTCASVYADPTSWVEAIHPEDRPRVIGAVAASRMGVQFDREYRVVRPDGSLRWVHDHGSPILGLDGSVERLVGVAQDITDRRHFEEQFLQSQKLEAIGRLAGGVAHDFNNILAAMMLLVEDVSTDSDASPATRDSMADMMHALDRAAGLTRQLLAFSRRQVMRPRPIDVNDVVNDLVKMLRRILGEDIRLRLDLHPGGMVVEADTGMLEQVLMNLAVNARDAMPDGGSLVLETAHEVLDEAAALAIPEGTAGDYARIRMTDTGSGIAPENLEHVFEPFFTTKELGKGTGLGLATVFGIVRQHHGLVRVTSVVNQGTTFDVLLPVVRGEADVDEAPVAVKANPRGTETILVVEDDAAVRRVTQLALERHGYTVIVADSGPAALDQLAEHGPRIDLLLTDVVMPEGMTGIELAAQVALHAPRVKVILTSGYSPDLAERASEHRFIQKPCRPHDLLVAVREVLDGR